MRDPAGWRRSANLPVSPVAVCAKASTNTASLQSHRFTTLPSHHPSSSALAHGWAATTTTNDRSCHLSGPIPTTAASLLGGMQAGGVFQIKRADSFAARLGNTLRAVRNFYLSSRIDCRGTCGFETAYRDRHARGRRGDPTHDLSGVHGRINRRTDSDVVHFLACAGRSLGRP